MGRKQAWIGIGMGLLAALGALSPPAAVAQSARTPDLSGLSVEELADLDVVYAASRHHQSQREAPSFVTVVTAAEIRRFGHRTLADVLRSLPSFHVTDDHNYTYVGVRGFGIPGDYNTRILLLVDGVRVNDTLYDQAFVGREFPVDMALVDRIEVVRGPGAAVYGNSAFFAVINVITRRGHHLDGGELAFEGGSRTMGGVRASYGGRRGGLDYVVSGSFWRTDGEDLFFPEFSSEPGGGFARGLDGERSGTAFAALRYQGLSLQFAHADRAKDVPTASYDTAFGDPRTATVDRSTHVAVTYERDVRGIATVARAYHGRYDYSGTYAYPDDWLFDDGSNARWWGLEWQGTTTRRGGHLLTFGGEGRWAARQRQWAREPDGPTLDVDHPSTTWGAFVQDDVRLGAHLSANVGLRYDRNGASAGRVSPRAGLVLKPTDVLTIKALYGSAFRTPNDYEQHYYTTQRSGLSAETIRTFELVVERTFGGDLHLTAAGFHSDIDALLELRTDEAGTLSFWNAGRTHAQGVEVAAEARRARELRLRASYTYQLATDRESGAVLPNAPRHTAKVTAALPLGPRVQGGLSLRYLGRRKALLGGWSDGAVLADLTASVPSLWQRLDLTLAVRNVFGTAWTDPGSAEHHQRLIPQDGRQVEIRALWRF